MDDIRIDPEDRDMLLRDYSDGMKMKMQMLVSILIQPKLLLLDEPLTSFDAAAIEEMKKLLHVWKPGCITILSMPHLNPALELCDVIVLLNHGRLEGMPRGDLENQEFKTKLAEILREERSYE